MLTKINNILSIKKRIMLGLLMVGLMSIDIQGASYLMLTDLGSSAEMIRRGNIEGFSQGSNSIFENPAALYRVKNVSTSVFATQLMEEVEYKNVSVAISTGVGVFSLGYMDAGVDDIYITRMTDDGYVETNGTFSYKNRLAKIGYQKSITDTLHLGVNGVGYMNEIYTYTGSGYSIDAGAIYSFSEITVSLFARNLIPTVVTYTDSADESYSGEEELPLQVVLGVGYPFGDVDILGQFKFDGINTLMSAGVDYTPHFLFGMLTLSAGYKEFSVLDSISNTTTLGVGLNIFGVSMDYAYERSDHFEYDSNTFASIGIDF